ncbi:hypothetical protein BJX70DRAFT_409177 [Aspergillus crustosus]
MTMAHNPAAIEVRLIDEWKGVIDPKQRRTLQNRLNQRARRRHLKGPKSRSSTSDHHSDTTSPASDKPVAVVAPEQSSSPIEIATLDVLAILGPDAKNSKSHLKCLEQWLCTELASGLPRTDLLLGVKRVNFLRAFHANIDILGYTATEMHDDALSQFGSAGPVKSTFRDTSLLPPALRPTRAQLEICHHPWLDLIPIPRMLDNLILAGDTYDDIELCRQMSGHGVSLTPESRVGAAGGETGVIIWKDPWDPSGWEVTETFLRRWGWAVREYWDLFRSTNKWRAVRGEPPLFRLPCPE